MSLIDWAKEHPVVSAVSGVVVAGAVAAGVGFSGVLATDEPEAGPAMPVATAVAEATAEATDDPNAEPSESIEALATATASPSSSPSATASSQAPEQSYMPTPTASPSASKTPSAKPSKSHKDEVSAEDLDGIGGGQQAPEPLGNDAEIAEKFAEAYGNGGVGKAKWIKAMKPYSSPEFLEGFKGIDDQWIQVDEFESVSLKEEDYYTKIYNLRFASGLVETVKLTLADDYQTWVVSSFM